jgi:formylglycine-generating enzyme required for sulfatase activity
MMNWISVLRPFARLLVLLPAIAAFAADANAVAEESKTGARAPATITNSIGLMLVRVPAGEFLMGGQEPAEKVCVTFPYVNTTPEDFADEYPQHRVVISRAFLLGQFEVTLGQFRQFCEATGYETEAERDGTGGWGYEPDTGKCVGRRPQYNFRQVGFPQSDDHPVLNVTFRDAVAFCSWVSKKEGQRYRLPTEAEWEYACRAGSTTRFHFGDDPAELPRYAYVVNVPGRDEFAHVQHQVHFLRPGESLTAKVGSRLPNAFGLYDMLGNVWEWTNDWHSDDYYAWSPTVDPTGPGEGSRRIRRGGGWNSFPIYGRCSYRNLDALDSRSIHFGFRVACDE